MRKTCEKIVKCRPKSVLLYIYAFIIQLRKTKRKGVLCVLTVRDNDMCVYSSEYNRYEKFGSLDTSEHNCVCIDGTVCGCGKCVGYCQFSGHRGFLTQKLRKEHNCIKKNCIYYVGREKSRKTHISLTDKSSDLLEKARKASENIEGFRFIKAKQDDYFNYILYYVTITDCYDLEDISGNLENMTDCKYSFEKLDYSFDKCAELISM